MFNGRSREGAWIEINILLYGNSVEGVAPARERGLKSASNMNGFNLYNVAPARERGLK